MNLPGTYFIYSVRDKVVGQFMQPIFFKNDEAAIRWFKAAVNDASDKQTFSCREDLELWAIGEFDYVNGVILAPTSERLKTFYEV